MNLKTFGNIKRQDMMKKSTGKEVILKSDKLFDHMILTVLSRKLSMKEVPKVL